MVPYFHKKNVYIKTKLRVWTLHKCIALIGTESVLDSAGPQTTPFQGGQYRPENGNLRKFEPTYPHGTAFPLKECLYLKRKLRVWTTQKCIALVRGKTVPTCEGLKLTSFMGGSIGPRMEICETSGLPIPMVPP